MRVETSKVKNHHCPSRRLGWTSGFQLVLSFFLHYLLLFLFLLLKVLVLFQYSKGTWSLGSLTWFTSQDTKGAGRCGQGLHFPRAILLGHADNGQGWKPMKPFAFLYDTPSLFLCCLSIPLGIRPGFFCQMCGLVFLESFHN